jgi:hypothetical protein
LEIHEWSVWIADPNVENANARERYQSAMPTAVTTIRSREVPRGEERLAPVSVITFYGDAMPDQEVTLQAASGQFVAHWPAAELKNRRLRWPQLALSPMQDDKASPAFVPDDHWFQQARKLDSLYVTSGARSERFLTYDVELKFPIPFKIEGGPDRFQITNLGKTPLHDLVLVSPSSEGRRVAWLDLLRAAPVSATPAKADTAKTEQPNAKPQSDSATGAKEPKQDAASAGTTGELILSAPLKNDTAEFESATRKTLAERLARAGLTAQETDLILSQYSKAFFESRELVVLFRLPPDAIDESVPLEIYPEPQKIVRVALALIRNIDPRNKDEVKALIARLGDKKYSDREAAEKRLVELGVIAVPALREALKDNDPEVVFRAERILLGRGEKIE